MTNSTEQSGIKVTLHWNLLNMNPEYFCKHTLIGTVSEDLDNILGNRHQPNIRYGTLNMGLRTTRKTFKYIALFVIIMPILDRNCNQFRYTRNMYMFLKKNMAKPHLLSKLCLDIMCFRYISLQVNMDFKCIVVFF